MPFLIERTARPAIIRIVTAPCTIGRGAACDVVLLRPTVSRLHARLSEASGRWMVRNESRTNPVMVNDAIVVTERLVNDGDVLVIGELEYRFAHAVDEAVATANRLSLHEQTVPFLRRGASAAEREAHPLLSGVVPPQAGAAGVLALVNSAGVTGRLTLIGREQATAWLDRGNVIGIQAGSARDAEAVTLLGRWRFDTFIVTEERLPARTLPPQWSFNRIVLEVGRLHDAQMREVGARK